MDISIQNDDIFDAFGPELGAKMIRDAGFTAVDWSLYRSLKGKTLKKAAEDEKLYDICIFEKSLEEVIEYYSDHIKAFRDNGLRITQAHAPFPAYLPGRDDVLDYCIKIYSRIIELCDKVGCKNLVIHGISPAPLEEAVPYEYYKALNYKLYRGLIPTLRNTNVTICLENLFRTRTYHGHTDYFEGTCSDPYEAVEYIDTLNAEAGRDDAFGFCLDVGHLHLLRKRFAYYIPVLGKRLKCLHLHDNDTTNDEHILPYAGTIIWNEFLDSMRDIGYDGDLSFETLNQTSTSTIPPELVPTFLRTIYDIGKYFQARIQ